METISERLLGDVTVFVDRMNHLEKENEKLRASQVNASRFYAVAFGVDAVSKMHDVSPYLVREYVKMGLIPQHPRSTQAKLLIRLSDALLLDFDALREEAKNYRRTR